MGMGRACILKGGCVLIPHTTPWHISKRRFWVDTVWIVRYGRGMEALSLLFGNCGKSCISNDEVEGLGVFHADEFPTRAKNV